MTNDAGEWLDWLDGEIRRAAEAMRGQLGEDSVCTVHKDGRVTGGIKYQEGRMSALAELRRALRTGSLDVAAIGDAEQRWSDEFERRRNGPSSPLWVSYATGGLDAIREARSALADEAEAFVTEDPGGTDQRL